MCDKCHKYYIKHKTLSSDIRTIRLWCAQPIPVSELMSKGNWGLDLVVSAETEHVKARHVVPNALLVRLQFSRKSMYMAEEGQVQDPLSFSMSPVSYCRRRRRFTILCPCYEMAGAYSVTPFCPSIIPSFGHSGFNFRSLSVSYMEIFKWNLVHRFVKRICRLSWNLWLAEFFGRVIPHLYY